MAPRRRENQMLTGFCDLVTGSLLPHLEPGPSPPRKLTREDERRVLLALSRVNKAIRGWGESQGLEPDDQETGSCPNEIHNCCLPHVQHLDDGFDCLTNTVSILVGFLGFCSDYVKHSIRNILVSMSISLIEYDIWIQFIELIWAAIHASSAPVSSTSKMDPNSRDTNTTTSKSTTSFIVLLQLRSHGISWQMIPSLFQVLHATLKFLKRNDSELKDDFICLSIHHIQKMSWESFHHLSSRELGSDATDSKLSGCHNLVESGILTGSLLQLLCCLLEKTSVEGTDRQDMYVKLVDIVPKLAASIQEQHHGPKSLYQYSKHKILVVMMRLKTYMQQDCSHIICWLKLLRQHFQDLLYETISQHIIAPDNCLDGSPFWLNMVDLAEVQSSNRHLQRRAIYLFLSCCICLSCNRNDGKLQCSCKGDDCFFDHKVQGCFDHCNCFGLSELSGWCERCYFDKSFDSKPLTDFSLSFLQLYMEEDDMLFSILLQLFNAPEISKKMDSIKATEMIGAELFSSIFDPIHLFHMLLMLLHYDHMVLVDYLISKDVGVDCAQYLLRCLRLVSQSWHDFVDGSTYETKIIKLTHKRQRTSKEIDGARCSSSKEGMNIQKLFFSAKACLLSLKRTVEDLHRKGLFPYNPRPLIRSLARFEELCEQEESV